MPHDLCHAPNHPLCAVNTPLSLTSLVRIPKSMASHELQGEILLLNSTTGACVNLVDVGARIWQLLQEDPSLQAVRDRLVQEYDVAEAQCEQDILGFVAQMLEQGFVEPGTAETG